MEEYVRIISVVKRIPFGTMFDHTKVNMNYVQIFRSHHDWTLVSNSVKAGGNFVVLDLNPATWYNLKVTAHNNAGFSVAEYEFATLTVTGGKSQCVDYAKFE